MSRERDTTTMGDENPGKCRPAKHETKFLDHVDGPFPDLIWVRIKPWRRRHKESVPSAEVKLRQGQMRIQIALQCPIMKLDKYMMGVAIWRGFSTHSNFLF